MISLVPYDLANSKQATQRVGIHKAPFLRCFRAVEVLRQTITHRSVPSFVAMARVTQTSLLMKPLK